jgi:hypothetical protein
VPMRSYDDRPFTWADLLSPRLAEVDVFLTYFPSRFDLPVDEACMTMLRTFGKNTSARTSVAHWNPRDENFAAALELFGLVIPPAAVLARGLYGSEDAAANLYSMTFADRSVLEDGQQFATAVNLAHEVLLRGDPAAITDYIRRQQVRRLLDLLGKLGEFLRDQLVKLKPTLTLPGGISLGLG